MVTAYDRALPSEWGVGARDQSRHGRHHENGLSGVEIVVRPPPQRHRGLLTQTGLVTS